MENEEEVIVEPENEEVVEEVAEETPDKPEEKPKAEKPKRTPEEELAYLEGRAKRIRKDLGRVAPEEKPPQTGELDKADYALLAAKGIEDDAKIELAQKVMKKTGQDLRQTLKDDYVLAKFKEMDADQAVKNATPSSTKRSGGQSNSVEAALAKYESTGKLPDDFELRSAVINAKESKDNTNKPSWHK